MQIIYASTVIQNRANKHTDVVILLLVPQWTVFLHNITFMQDQNTFYLLMYKYLLLLEVCVLLLQNKIECNCVSQKQIYVQLLFITFIQCRPLGSQTVWTTNNNLSMRADSLYYIINYV